MPYICTFEGCVNGLEIFPTRAKWADHEFDNHRIERLWYCPECAEQWDSEARWTKHFEECHHQVFVGKHYETVRKRACSLRVKPAENERCPLCLVVPGKSRRNFVKHVGRHMEEIALMALPRDLEEDDEFSSEMSDLSLQPKQNQSQNQDQALMALPQDEEDNEFSSDLPDLSLHQKQNQSENQDQFPWFKPRTPLASPLASNTSFKRHKCSECEMTFALHSNLNRHLKEQHRSKATSYPYSFCIKTFTRKSYQLHHENICPMREPRENDPKE